MKVFIDTNILISAALFPNGTAAQAYRKAVADPNCGIISDYSVSELADVFNRKFKNRIPELNSFLVTALTTALFQCTCRSKTQFRKNYLKWIRRKLLTD